MRLKSLMLLSGLALLLSAAPVRADLAFFLTPAVQSGLGSNEIVFTGTLINTSPTDDLFLNNIQISLIGGAAGRLTADTNVFFANVPGILLPGETYSDVVLGSRSTRQLRPASISASSLCKVAQTFLRPPIWPARYSRLRCRRRC
jgi:hypothetical protein